MPSWKKKIITHLAIFTIGVAGFIYILFQGLYLVSPTWATLSSPDVGQMVIGDSVILEMLIQQSAATPIVTDDR